MKLTDEEKSTLRETLPALDEAYCVAANALWEYRRKMGFEPGVRVRCQSSPVEEPIMGTICQFGDDWSAVDRMYVPVRLDKGYRQPWDMAHLTIIETQP